MALQSDHEFAPTEIARVVFPTAFRGYDQDAVRRYLSRLAAALEHQQTFEGLGELEARTPAHDRVDELEAEISALQQEVRDLEGELVQRAVDEAESESRRQSETVDFDERRAVELLGQETARVLESARSAAADIVQRSEEQATALKAEAKQELVEAKRRSAELLTQREREADELVERLTRAAEAEADRIVDEAEQHRVGVVAESTQVMDEAEAAARARKAGSEERARQIVADAEALRRQIVAELVAERRSTQAELDRLAHARDRLSRSLLAARSDLDQLADALVAETPAGDDEPSQGASRSGQAADFTDLADFTDVAEGDPVDAEPDDAEPGDADAIDGDPEVAELVERLDSESSGHAGPVLEPTVEMDVVAADADLDPAPDDQSAERPAPEAASTGSSADEPVGSAGVFDLDPAGGEAADPDFDQDREPAPAQEVLELAESEPGDEPDVDTIFPTPDVLNDPPAEGEQTSLVEGFSTIVLDDRSEGGLDLDAPADGRNGSPAGNGSGTTATSTKRGAKSSKSPTTSRRPAAAEPEIEVEADRDPAPEAEPVDPALAITTVSARTIGSLANRSQGDLLLEEPPPDRLPEPFAARDVAMTRSGPNLRRQLRRALNDDQSVVLERLRGGRGPISVDELLDRADQVAHYLPTLGRSLETMTRAGARAGGVDGFDSAVLDRLVELLGEFIVDRVRMATEAAVEAADHNDRERVLEPVRAIYRDFRNLGLPELTEDALHEAFAIGYYGSIADDAVVAWVIDPRTDPDPVCTVNADRHGLAKGEVFPSGHVRPLALPGCRCLVVPVS